MDATSIFILLIIFVDTGCQPDRRSTNAPSANVPDSVGIVLKTSDTVRMERKVSHYTDVSGTVAGILSEKDSLDEVYSQHFRNISGALVLVRSGTRTGNGQTLAFYDSLPLDRLGNPVGSGSPLAMTPLLPEKPVARNQYWKPAARVTTSMGQGSAAYRIVVDSIYRDGKGLLLARILVAFQGTLEPAAPFRHATVSGGGSVTWDCGAGRLRSSQLTMTCDGKSDGGEVYEITREQLIAR